MIEIEHSRQDDNIAIRVAGTVSRRDVDLAVPEIEPAPELRTDRHHSAHDRLLE
ncbi:MAG: hypothetical protein ACQEVT_08985 [Pseudomonadota bacterium]|uniref:hypothetical protein n=1 Tax=Roseovarius TaxID=74030 RepID=UPI0022A86A92|nr:hypothetical protein [Roseovarius sp. EGI FJ00037]MCZ0813070.1 hypothetical protein [Roseovarius sp. EGI FJ00037]